MKIALAAIHSNDDFIPLALLYLKSYLVEKCNYPINKIEIIEFNKKTDTNEIAAQLISTCPDVIGLSCYIWNIEKIIPICKILKDFNPKLKIVLGGPEVGPVSKSILEAHPYIDVVVKSEGEIVFSQLIHCFQNNDQLSDLAGISYRQGKTVTENINAPILKDLNELPSPHNRKYGNFKNRYICIETQRGCVFKCSFCFYNKDFSIRNRKFDLDRIKAELLYWFEQDIDNIYLMDPIFNLHASRAKEICRYIIENRKKKLTIHTEIWAEFVDDELAELFSLAGFKFLEVGLQTSEHDVLKTIERRLKLEPFIKGINSLNKYKLKIELQLIFGLPGENLASFKNSIDFAESLAPYKIAIFPLMILPGTQLWRDAKKLGIEHEKKPFYKILKTPDLNETDRDYGIRVSESIDTLYSSLTVKLMSKALGWTLSQIIDHWINYNCEYDHVNLDTCKSEDLNRILSKFVEFICTKNNLNFNFYKLILDKEVPTPKWDRPPAEEHLPANL